MPTLPPPGYARPVSLSSPAVDDGVLWLTWDGEYIITSSVNNPVIHETMAFPSNATGAVVDWRELAVTGPGDHAGCIEAAGYAPLGTPRPPIN